MEYGSNRKYLKLKRLHESPVTSTFDGQDKKKTNLHFPRPETVKKHAGDFFYFTGDENRFTGNKSNLARCRTKISRETIYTSRETEVIPQEMEKNHGKTGKKSHGIKSVMRETEKISCMFFSSIHTKTSNSNIITI
jgi:hypothetical protein